MSRFLDRLQAGEPVTLSALGDSLTYGYMVRQGYLEMVTAQLRNSHPGCQLTVRNHGHCGDTIYGGSARAEEAFAPPRPDLAFIEFGLNDCFQGMPPTYFEKSLQQLVNWCRTHAPTMELLLLPPIPIEPPEFDRAAEPFRTAYATVATVAGIAMVDFKQPWQMATASPLWQADGVHPTEAGYRVMAEAVLDALADM